MKLACALEFSLGLHNCVFRTLTIDDVTDDYVGALMAQRKYLLRNPPLITLEWQKTYVERILDSESDTIMGLFVGEELVATSGIQAIHQRVAPVIGIFVLKPENRGRGFGKTVVWAASRLAQLGAGAERLEAGMELDNLPSLRAFLACGFSIVGESPAGYRVGASLTALRQPDGVFNVQVVHS